MLVAKSSILCGKKFEFALVNPLNYFIALCITLSPSELLYHPLNYFIALILGNNELIIICSGR